MGVMAAVIIVTVIGLLGAAILVVASKFMHVEVDERVTQIIEVLPAVNCGACGFAGCADYAEGVVAGADANLCVPGGSEVASVVASIMGVDAGNVVKKKAIVACQGTHEFATQQYEYFGAQTCKANSELFGGSSSCSYGCLGFGDCKIACKFDAIEVQNGVARVNTIKCTGCGACELACPKKIIWIREESEKPVVMCANHERGAVTRKECTAGCIGCMKCEKVCPTKAIKVKNNVARIDLDKCNECGECVSSCPTKAIAIPKGCKMLSAASLAAKQSATDLG